MKAHPDVLAALHDAHNAEATAEAKFHLQEHAFKDGDMKLPKLAKWFHKRHQEAYDRQHDLRGTIMEYGGKIATKLGDVSYSDDPKEALEKACETLDGLAAAHQAVHDTTKDVMKDMDGEEKAYHRGILEEHRDTVQDLYDTYRKGEKKQRLLRDLGPALFKLKHS